MTDTTTLAALLHQRHIDVVPNLCYGCEQEAARLIAAGVRVAPSDPAAPLHTASGYLPLGTFATDPPPMGEVLPIKVRPAVDMTPSDPAAPLVAAAMLLFDPMTHGSQTHPNEGHEVETLCPECVRVRAGRYIAIRRALQAQGAMPTIGLRAAPPSDAALREAAQAVVDSAHQSRHIVQFSRTGYGLQHPLSCRPDLLKCPVQRYLASKEYPDRKPGRYFIALEATDVVYEPTKVPDPLMPFIGALAALRAALATPKEPQSEPKVRRSEP